MTKQTTDKVTQDEINRAAWAACDTFRGVVDAGQYKDYILVILFLKYVSDLWADHYRKYQKQFDGDDVRIARRMKNERFDLPFVTLTKEIKDEKTGKIETVETDKFRASFDSLYERRDMPNIGELINLTLEAIEEKNRDKLEGVFRNIDFNSEANLGKVKDRNARLKLMMEDFNKPELDLRPSRVSADIIGECYIYLIERFASDGGKKAGEFYTPEHVALLLAKLAMPEEGQTICDPACGSGSLLIRAGDEVGGQNFALFGQEVNGATWALARMNMFLHAMDSARIEWCDTLRSPALLEENKKGKSTSRLMTFDRVVANPPFSLDKWGYDEAEKDIFGRFERGIPPKSKGDYAFISHMLKIAKPQSGRVAVIVPHGVLFRAAAEGRIRKALIEENLLDAVIGLPEKLFSTTGIPVAILIFDRAREKGGALEQRKDVLFIDASREFTSAKKTNLLETKHSDKIMQTYLDRKPLDKYASVVSFEEIKENDFNLNIPRYVDTFEAEETIDIVAVQSEIKQLETELVEVRNQMDVYLREFGIDG